MPVPKADEVKLKDPRHYKLLGTRIGGVDNRPSSPASRSSASMCASRGPAHSHLRQMPGVWWQGAQCQPGGHQALPGVRDAFVVEGTSNLNGLMPGVAIVAEHTWAALSARKQLRVDWDEALTPPRAGAAFVQQADTLGPQPGAATHRRDGDVNTALQAAAKTVTARYEYPFISTPASSRRTAPPGGTTA